MAPVLLDSGEYRIIRRLEPQTECTQKTTPPRLVAYGTETTA
jgi:hypothetical protein